MLAGCSIRRACLTVHVASLIFGASVNCPSLFEQGDGNGETVKVPVVWP